jgi:hypothetical protein
MQNWMHPSCFELALFCACQLFYAEGRFVKGGEIGMYFYFFTLAGIA